MLLAYEKTGYDASQPGRLPDLLDEWSVRRLVEAGANAIKILLYYNAADDARINTIKQAFIERVGAECQAYDIPFFLEPLAYNDALGDEKGPEFAKTQAGTGDEVHGGVRQAKIWRGRAQGRGPGEHDLRRGDAGVRRDEGLLAQ